MWKNIFKIKKALKFVGYIDDILELLSEIREVYPAVKGLMGELSNLSDGVTKEEIGAIRKASAKTLDELADVAEKSLSFKQLLSQ
jgi:hypothetical protein